MNSVIGRAGTSTASVEDGTLDRNTKKSRLILDNQHCASDLKASDLFNTLSKKTAKRPKSTIDFDLDSTGDTAPSVDCHPEQADGVLSRGSDGSRARARQLRRQWQSLAEGKPLEPIEVAELLDEFENAISVFQRKSRQNFHDLSDVVTHLHQVVQKSLIASGEDSPLASIGDGLGSIVARLSGTHRDTPERENLLQRLSNGLCAARLQLNMSNLARGPSESKSLHKSLQRWSALAYALQAHPESLTPDELLSHANECNQFLNKFEKDYGLIQAEPLRHIAQGFSTLLGHHQDLLADGISPHRMQWDAACVDIQERLYDLTSAFDNACRRADAAPAVNLASHPSARLPGIGRARNLQHEVRKAMVRAGGALGSGLRHIGSPSLRTMNKNNADYLKGTLVDRLPDHHDGLTPEIMSHAVAKAIEIIRNSPIANIGRAVKSAKEHIMGEEPTSRSATRIVAEAFDLRNKSSAVNKALQSPAIAQLRKSGGANLSPEMAERVVEKFVHDLAHATLDEELKLSEATSLKQADAMLTTLESLKEQLGKLYATFSSESVALFKADLRQYGATRPSTERAVNKMAQEAADKQGKLFDHAESQLKKQLGALPGFTKDSSFLARATHDAYYEKLLSPGARAGLAVSAALLPVRLLTPAGQAAVVPIRALLALAGSMAGQSFTGADASAAHFHKRAELPVATAAYDPTTERMEREFRKEIAPLEKQLQESLVRQGPRIVGDCKSLLDRIGSQGLRAEHHASLLALSILDQGEKLDAGVATAMRADEVSERITALLYKYDSVISQGDEQGAPTDAAQTLERVRQAIAMSRQNSDVTSDDSGMEFARASAQIGQHWLDEGNGPVLIKPEHLVLRHELVEKAFKPYEEFLAKEMQGSFGSDQALRSLRHALTANATMSAVSSIVVGLGTSIATAAASAVSGPVGGLAVAAGGVATQYLIGKVLRHVAASYWTSQVRKGAFETILFKAMQEPTLPSRAELAKQIRGYVSALSPQRIKGLVTTTSNLCSKAVVRTAIEQTAQGRRMVNQLFSQGFGAIAGVEDEAFKLAAYQALENRHAPKVERDAKHLGQVKALDAIVESTERHLSGLDEHNASGQTKPGDAYRNNQKRRKILGLKEKRQDYISADSGRSANLERLSKSREATCKMIDAYFDDVVRRGALVSTGEIQALSTFLRAVDPDSQTEAWIAAAVQRLSVARVLVSSNEPYHLGRESNPRALKDWQQRNTVIADFNRTVRDVVSDLYLTMNNRVEETSDHHGLIKSFLHEHIDASISDAKKVAHTHGLGKARATGRAVVASGLTTLPSAFGAALEVVAVGLGMAVTAGNQALGEIFRPTIATLDGHAVKADLISGPIAAGVNAATIPGVSDKLNLAQFANGNLYLATHPGLVNTTRGAAIEVASRVGPTVRESGIVQPGDTVAFESVLSQVLPIGTLGAQLREYTTQLGTFDKSEFKDLKLTSVLQGKLEEAQTISTKAPWPKRACKKFGADVAQAFRVTKRLTHNVYKQELAAYLVNLARQQTVREIFAEDSSVLKQCELLAREHLGNFGVTQLSVGAEEFLRKEFPDLANSLDELSEAVLDQSSESDIISTRF